MAFLQKKTDSVRKVKIFLIIVVSYLLGTILFGWVLSRVFMHVDIRKIVTGGLARQTHCEQVDIRLRLLLRINRLISTPRILLLGLTSPAAIKNMKGPDSF